jgi:hypothetical protein
MATGRRYSAFTSILGYATSQTFELKQIDGVDYTPNAQTTQYHAAGAVDVSANIVTQMEPEFRIRTPDLAQLLTSVISWTGGKVFDEQSNIYFRQREDGGTFGTSTVNYSQRFTKAFAYIEEISAGGPDQIAVATLVICCLNDGTNPTCLRVASIDLDAVTAPGFNSAYFLGPIFENSTEIEGVLSQTWRSGIEVSKVYKTPDASPTECCIVQRNPEVRFGLGETSESDLEDLQGRLVDTSMACYMQKADTTLAASNARIARGTAQHCKLGFTAGQVITESVSGNGNDDVEWEVIMRPTGTPTFSAASAIA